jgi:hypothetical protein
VRVLVCGSRSWTDEAAICHRLTSLPSDTYLIHGGADGADSIAATAAALLGVPQLVCIPDYETHGKRAPHVRNDAMLDEADLVIAFWDGESRGTKSVIGKARQLGIPIEVLSPKETE